jgi:hypothetical protein
MANTLSSYLLLTHDAHCSRGFRDAHVASDMGIPFGYPLLLYLVRLGPIWRQPEEVVD